MLFRSVDARAPALLQATRTHEAAAELPAPALGEDVLADYRASRLSLKAHPLSLLRDQLAVYKVQPAAVLALSRNGQLARACGLVTHRQALLAATLLTVYGVWQSQGDVRHLIAKTLIDHSALLQGLTVGSRDFH